MYSMNSFCLMLVAALEIINQSFERILQIANRVLPETSQLPGFQATQKQLVCYSPGGVIH